MKRFISFTLLAVAALISGGSCAAPEPETALSSYPIDPDTGLRLPSLGPVPDLPEWADNPSSESRALLGKMLFTDIRLSGSGQLNCLGCHLHETFFQSNAVTDTPDRIHPEISPRLHRNTPSLLNLVHAPECRWDGGHCEDLGSVLMLPFAEPNMNLTPGIPWDDIHTIDVPLAQKEFRKRVVQQIPGYVTRFEDAFGVDIEELSDEAIWKLGGKALAVLFRKAVLKDADFDRWNAGDDSAMTDAQVRGLDVFLGKGLCVACHNGPLLSNFNYHNMSVEPVLEDGTRADEGRYLVTGKEEDRGRFLTPTLRGVAMSAPWFHDGSSSNMRKLIEHITGPGGRMDPNHDPLLDMMEPLTDDELSDLAQFLKALIGEHPDPSLFAIALEDLPSVDLFPPGATPVEP